MIIAYRGNFQPGLPEGVVPWSTESHVAATLELLGHTVIRLQEDTVPWPEVVNACRSADIFLWTSTFSMAHIWDQRQAWDAVRTLNTMLPTAAFHLDRFFDLPRESQVVSEPWFRLNHVFTADGGNQHRFASFDINHHWLPPAVFQPECFLGTPTRPYLSDIAFVGSWRGHYHPESKHRFALIQHLQHYYRNRIRFWPIREAIRGADLNNLYASAKVIVGDSCLVGTPAAKMYWSDRISETTGRGGFLLHPSVPGLSDYHPHLTTFPAFEWSTLRDLINHYLAHPDERESIRLLNHEHTKANNTYTNRMTELLSIVTANTRSDAIAQITHFTQEAR